MMCYYLNVHFQGQRVNTVHTHRRTPSVSHAPSFQQAVLQTFLITSLFVHVPAICTCFPTLDAGRRNFKLRLHSFEGKRVIYFWWIRNPYQDPLTLHCTNMAACVYVKDAWFRFVTPEWATGSKGRRKKKIEKESSNIYRVADKSLARTGRKQATATKLLQATQKKFRMLSVQPGPRGSKDLRVGRKMATFQLFFSVWPG